MLQVSPEDALYQRLKDLHQLTISINHSDRAYLVLEYNGVDAMDFA